MTDSLDIDRINVDPDLQPRVDGLDADHVRALQECPDSWPPLVVVEDGGYRLIDGFHRFAAAQNLGLETIPVEVREVPSGCDLRALAFLLNAAHGRPLTLADRRTEACRLLSADPAVSNLEVARRTALSPTTVAGLREQLEAAETIPATEQRVSRSGVVYAPSSPRRPGELPAEHETITDRLFTAKDRRDQARLARYFKRLAVALDDGEDFESWRGANDAAEACKAVFGDDEAAELAARLAAGASNVLDVAEEIGHQKAEA
jgi:hypothetical protein